LDTTSYSTVRRTLCDLAPSFIRWQVIFSS